jgi:hypothetical protein
MVKWPKNLVLSVLLKKLPGKMMTIGSGHHFGPSLRPNCQKIVFVGFSQENSWNFFGHLASRWVPKVATSDGHHFARKFLEKN